jgi:hypothetical protein
MAKRKKVKVNDLRREVRALKKAIKITDPHSKKIVRDTAGEIVTMAHDEFIDGNLSSAADYYELAAWTFKHLGGIKYWGDNRKYNGMAKDIRKYNAREAKGEFKGNETGLVAKTMAISTGVFFLLAILFSFPKITGNLIGMNPSFLSIIPIVFFICGIVLLAITKIGNVPNPMVVGQAPLEKLVGKKIISSEAAKKLKARWVENIDGLYAQIDSLGQANDDESLRILEGELGIGEGTIYDFQEKLKEHVSLPILYDEPVDPPPLGLR